MTLQIPRSAFDIHSEGSKHVLCPDDGSDLLFPRRGLGYVSDALLHIGKEGLRIDG